MPLPTVPRPQLLRSIASLTFLSVGKLSDIAGCLTLGPKLRKAEEDRLLSRSKIFEEAVNISVTGADRRDVRRAHWHRHRPAKTF